jgi:hypothetical protein
LKKDPRTGVREPDKEQFDRQDQAQKDARERVKAQREGKAGPPVKG